MYAVNGTPNWIKENILHKGMMRVYDYLVKHCGFCLIYYEECKDGSSKAEFAKTGAGVVFDAVYVTYSKTGRAISATEWRA